MKNKCRVCSSTSASEVFSNISIYITPVSVLALYVTIQDVLTKDAGKSNLKKT